MGVSLGYYSTRPVSATQLRQLLALAAAANEAYDWWCESIWVAERSDEAGNAFGFTKLLCMIDDEDTDTHVAYLVVCEIALFLTSATERLGIEWRLAAFRFLRPSVRELVTRVMGGACRRKKLQLSSGPNIKQRCT